MLFCAPSTPPAHCMRKISRRHWPHDGGRANEAARVASTSKVGGACRDGRARWVVPFAAVGKKKLSRRLCSADQCTPHTHTHTHHMAMCSHLSFGKLQLTRHNGTATWHAYAASVETPMSVRTRIGLEGKESVGLRTTPAHHFRTPLSHAPAGALVPHLPRTAPRSAAHGALASGVSLPAQWAVP
jgi:hypothetical protein